MDRPASQDTLVSYLITLLPLLFRWSNTGFSGVTVHPVDVEAPRGARHRQRHRQRGETGQGQRSLTGERHGKLHPYSGRRLSPTSTAPTRPPRRPVLGAVARSG